jgi:hypothetical protein
MFLNLRSIGPSSAGDGHRMNHENDSIRIDQIHHPHPPITLSPTIHKIFSAFTPGKTSAGIIYYFLRLLGGASVLAHFFDIPFDPPKFIPPAHC